MAGAIHGCPHCGDFYGASFLYLGDGLGSPIFICGKCKQPFNSEKHEWASMGMLRRGWYVIASSIFIAGFGFVGGLVALATQLKPGETHVAPSGPYFWGGLVGMIALTTLIQFARMFLSLRRTQGKTTPHMNARFLSLQTNLQGVLGITLMAIGLGSFLYTQWLRSMIYGPGV